MVRLQPISISSALQPHAAGGHCPGQKKSRASLKNEGQFQASDLFTPSFQSLSLDGVRTGLNLPSHAALRASLDLEQMAGGAPVQEYNPRGKGIGHLLFREQRPPKHIPPLGDTVSHTSTALIHPSFSSRGAIGSTPAPQFQVVLFAWEWEGGGEVHSSACALFKGNEQSQLPMGFCEAYVSGGCKRVWEDDLAL